MPSAETLTRVLAVVALVGCGLVGGVLFAFSAFVMRALERLSPAEGVAAMRSINAEAPTAWFMAAFLGTALACAVLAVTALTRWGERATPWLLAGCGLYLVAVVITVVYHVPRNDALAALTDPGSAEAGRQWAAYVPGWTAWNHVRTLAATGGAAALAVALRLG